jgi:hypothetical protein
VGGELGGGGVRENAIVLSVGGACCRVAGLEESDGGVNGGPVVFV